MSRLNNRKNQIREEEKYNETDYVIEKETLDGIIDILLKRENKHMTNATSYLKKYNKKKLQKNTSEVSSAISSISTQNDKNFFEKVTKYAAEFKEQWDKALNSKEYKWKIKVVDHTDEAIDVDELAAKKKEKVEKTKFKKNKRVSTKKF